MQRMAGQRHIWLTGSITASVVTAVVALTLLWLQTPASGGRPTSSHLAHKRHEALLTSDDSEQVASSAGWQTVFSETFESGIGPDWTVADISATDGGTYLWGTSTLTHVIGGRSAWCAGGGDEAGDLYVDGMDAWLVSDPIALGEPGSGVWDAEVRFAWWLDTLPSAGGRGQPLTTQSLKRVESPPPSGDWLGWAVLTDVTGLESGQEPDGQWTYVSGASAGWMHGSIPLAGFLPLTNGLTSTVRIAFRFVSDADGAVGQGAFIDNVVLGVNRGYEVALPLVLRERLPAPTPTPTPTSTPTPTPTPTPASILRNGSFEEGWYDISIGQVPNGWAWHWVDQEMIPGADALALAPETRVLPREHVPPQEWDLFFVDGWYCLKVFKQFAPMYAAISQDASGLEVGRRYRLTVPLYVDVIDRYEGGEKVPPSDPGAAEIWLGVGPTDATWRDDEAVVYSEPWNGHNTADFYLTLHEFSFDFTATHPAMTVFVRVFGKQSLNNNGFFMDDLKLLALP